MYFDSRPKEARADLYNYDAEYGLLRGLLGQRAPLVLVKGLRRTGKTSLIRTCLNEEKYPYVWIDMKSLEQGGGTDGAGLLGLFESNINRFIDKAGGRADRIVEKLSRVSGVQAMGSGISFHDKSPTKMPSLHGIFAALDDWAGSHAGTSGRMVLVIDEAQHLDNVKGLDMRQVIASIHDNCRNILIVLSGSEIGLFEKFVAGVGESGTAAGGPLSPFVTEEVVLSYLSRPQQREYLEAGLAQINPGYTGQEGFDRVVSEAMDTFGGVIGWLNNVGLKFKSKRPISRHVIDEVLKSAQRTVKLETESLFSVRPNPAEYRSVMRQLSLDREMLPAGLAGRLPSVPQDRIMPILDDLVDYGFAEKNGDSGGYSVTEPLYRRYFRESYIN